MTGMLTLTEDDDFRFDEEAADRPCRFIEKYCIHFEGRHAGKPFILHPVQRRMVQDWFGWKWRRGPKEGFRRFTDVYLEAAVGMGKSPLLAGVGLYGLMADGEEGAEVFSLASKFEQAKVVFDTAKKFAGRHRELERRLDIVEREIRHPASASKWKIVSGDGPGAGGKPHIILGDEAHQWKGGLAFKDLHERALKKDQSLSIVATNAGKSRASFCWQLRERAMAALAGAGDERLYPAIFAATLDEEKAPNIRTDDPAAWRAANPLLGTTVPEENVRATVTEMMKDPAEEADARRLYLGLWPRQTAGAWLDMAEWDACMSYSPPPADAPLYVAFDLSKVDDLSAAAFVWPTPDRFYVGSFFWIPKTTAARYQEKYGIPYQEWADAGHISLRDEPTINSRVRIDIADAIIARHKRNPIKAVCYDRAYKAEECVSRIEAAGITCVPVGQGWGVDLGSSELERRLRERSVSIWPSPVLRFCAENTEVKSDERGNFWPVKPNAKGRYAGTRWKKVDGITALVTALTEARKHSFPSARKMSTAAAYII